MSTDPAPFHSTRIFSGRVFISLLPRLPWPHILTAAVLSLLPPLVFRMILRSDIPAAILFPAVVLTTVLGITNRLVGRLWLRLVSYTLITFFALIILTGLLITPYSVYLVWGDLLRAGAQRGAVSNLFTLVASLFSCTIAPMVLTTGYLWPMLVLGLITATLMAIMVQDPVLFYLVIGFLTLCLVYQSIGRNIGQNRTGGSNGTMGTKRGGTGAALYTLITLILTFVVITLFGIRQDPRQIRLVNQKLHPALRQAVVKLFPGFPLLYGIPGYGYSYSQSELGAPPSLSSRPIFEVSGPPGETLYLRTSVFDTYDGSSWATSSNTAGSTGESIRPPFLYGSIDDPSDIRLTLRVEMYSRLPHTIDTINFRFPERGPPLRAGNIREGIRIDPPLINGDTVLLERGEPLYRQRIDIFSSQESGIRRSGDGIIPFLRPYLQVHNNLPQEVRELARQLAESAEATIVLRNIDRHITVNQAYSLNPKTIAPGDDFVRGFLFDTKEGFCVHFATSFVILARLSGIPARYVTGFLAYLPPDGSPATVTGHSSHAWAEVWIEGAGWVQWEATHALDRRSYEEVEDGLMYEFEMDLDRETSRQIEAVLGSEVRDRPVETAGVDRKDIDGFALGPLALLVGLIVAIGLLWTVRPLHLLRMQRPGMMTHETGREVRFHRRARRLVRRLCRLGIPHPTEYGWANWAYAVQQHFPNYSATIKEYCDILCAYVYGGQALDPSWTDSWNRLQNISGSDEHL
jgi:transglutaminase-like putative cysteine protease